MAAHSSELAEIYQRRNPPKDQTTMKLPVCEKAGLPCSKPRYPVDVECLACLLAEIRHELADLNALMKSREVGP